MAAIDRLRSAVTSNASALDRNTAAINRVVTEWNKPNPTEDEVNAAAETVETQTGRLNDNSAILEGLVTPQPPAAPANAS